MTHEQLLRIYWAAQPDGILRCRGKYGNYYIVGYNKGGSFGVLPKIEASMFAMHYSHMEEEFYKPLLRPLSSITDEDAIAVANICYEAKTWQVEYRDKNRVEVQTGKHKTVFWFENNKIVSQWKSDMLQEWLDIGYVPYSQITDYLRSKSYNLDFEPINFIEI